jgi:sialate O-acetylesterase
MNHGIIIKRAILAWLLGMGGAMAQPAPTLLFPAFQDHAVLQRGKPMTIWGHAAPESRVHVTLAQESADARTDASGEWKVTLPALPAGGPYELTAVSDKGERESLHDIMIGDVFLCSGQSNMEMPVRIASNYDADLVSANNTMIRLMHVNRFASAAPRKTFGAPVTWAVTSPANVREFSAACYYFGRALQPHLGVAVGLINDSWGGTVIEAWLGEQEIRAVGGYEKQLAVMADYTRAKEQALRRWREDSNAWWKAHDPGSAASPAWYDPAYDDSHWAQIVPAGDWEGWGVAALTDFDGIVWFRKTVTLSAAQTKGNAVLSLGPVDDVDSTWVNGKSVGAREGWDTPRVYTLPAGTLHEGVNVIAVGVLDLGAGGGMWGPASAKTLKLGDGSVIALDTPWRYKISAPLSQTGSIPHAPWLPESGLSMLYNGMIAPLGPLGLKGIIWYQGESNSDNARDYDKLLTALVGEMRAQFGAAMPFLVVQLPNFGPKHTTPQESNWAILREAQRKVTDALPHMGLAVTIDVGQDDNIHPTDKQAVGARLALLARQIVYGEPIEGRAPAPRIVTRKAGVITVAFANVGTGLATYESQRALGFQLCDAAMQCRFADAALTGNRITLDGSQMPDAVVLRFCWADSPICNLYNSAGLPATPFEMPIGDARE